MASISVANVTAVEAQATASLLLSDNLPDRISAGTPSLDDAAGVWRVPVVLSYPLLGVLGQVGEVLVDIHDAKRISFTPIDEMLALATALAEEQRDVIEAPLP